MTPVPGPLVVGVGLLVVLLDIPGFGVDFANDIVGFALVAWAAWRSRPAGRWSLVAVLAGVAAVVSVFGYGGPASHVLVFGDATWTWIVVTEMLARSAVFVAVLWALTGSSTLSRRARGVLVVTSVVLAAAALGWSLILALAGGVAGTSGLLAQGFAVVVGLIQGLAAVLSCTFSHKR